MKIKKMKNRLIKGLSLANIIGLVLALVLPALYFTQKAEASDLTFALLRTDRMLAATATTGTICVNPTNAVGSSGRIMVTFPSSGSWTLGASGTWTVDTTNKGWPATATAWTGVTTGTVSGQTVTFSGGPAMSNGTIYCFNWTNTAALTTGSAGNNQTAYVETQNSSGTMIDRTAVSLATVNGSSSYDQVTVNGTITSSFSFSLDSNTATFTNIGTSVTNTSSTPVATISTNARNGWSLWVKDSNNGTLNSAGTGQNIPTPGAVGSNYDMSTMTTNGAFGLGITTSGGSSAADAEYASTTYSGNGAGALSNNFRRAAYSTTYASGDQITIRPKAIAKATQAPAADYTDTLTIIAAGLF